MMWNEFEELAGYEVSYEDYTEIIEPMYMATNLSKTEFIATLNRERFDKGLVESKLLDEMKSLADQIRELCGRDETCDLERELQDKAEEFGKKFGPVAVTLETAKGYGNCHYVTAVSFTEKKHWSEVERIDFAA